MTNTVSPPVFAARILELLQASSDATLEIQLCRDGSLRITKEDAKT